MSWNDSLLADPSPWESAVEEASASRWPLEWSLLRTLHDPDRIPADKLAILAWALSVDLWDESWPIEKKRSVVRSAILDHSLKGTIAGVRRYLEIEDGDLVAYLTPPQRMFASASLTKEQMDEWLSSMPELRIYLQSRPGNGTGLAFVEDAYAGVDFAGFDAAWAIYGRFPVVRDRGVVYPLRSAEILTSTSERSAFQIERISTPGIGGFNFASDCYAGHAYTSDGPMKPALFTLRTDRTYSHTESELALTTATPGLEPVNVRYRRRSEIGNGGAAAFEGDFASGPYFIRPDEGAWMLYDQIYLHDPSRAAPLVDALSFAGDGRVSMRPFHAEYMVDGNTKADDVPAFEGDFVGQGFARAEDLGKIERQMDALAAAKRYTEKALVTFETTRARTWGDGYPLDGSVPIWSRVEAAL